jgi:hypothetical protein
MSDKMLKFINIGQQNPPKRGVSNRKDDLTRFTRNLFKKKLVNKQVDALSVESHFAKFIAL